MTDMSEAMEKDLLDIKKDRPAPTEKLGLQIEAILREYGRDVMERGLACPCCGRKSRKK